MNDKALIAFVEQLPPADFARIMLRLPEATGHVADNASPYERASSLIRFCRSATGPGMTKLLDIVQSLRPDQDDSQKDSNQGFVQRRDTPEDVRSTTILVNEGDVMVSQDPKKVFIVYGRNTRAHVAMTLFLRSIGLEPLNFDDVRNDLRGSPFVGQIVKTGMERAKAIIILFTPDEFASLEPRLRNDHDDKYEAGRLQARPNVILEAGMALAIDEARTIIVVLGPVELASDLHGRHYIRMSNGTPARTQLLNALKGVNCEVTQYLPDFSNTPLVGDFDSAIHPSLDINSIADFWSAISNQAQSLPAQLP